MDNRETLAIPTVWINGTKGQDLFDDYSKAIDAIRDAVSAIKMTEPNGRDYFKGAFEIEHAIENHRLRVSRLEAVKMELEMIREAIQDQMDDGSMSVSEDEFYKRH